ncbi:hypothetical protein SYJ56_00900 [Algoriphagus sp. D3-2-R+10]|uniref:hypothetical protein n=1 Tax=Algoriphagus aurantiacus TaxID=3103948 RepID=UPI002B3E5676|nr:hypothetical protein [Algoriphagus sp. D3-2-R+10]MEB2773843.1 hypothetical protein [Algoriphagus sp. D3-2-R+10]
MLKNRFKVTIAIISAGLVSYNTGSDSSNQVTFLDRIPTENTNEFYISNRAPLAASALIKLPVCEVKPEGFLKEYLIRQKNGLTGNFGDISAWIQKENNCFRRMSMANGAGKKYPMMIRDAEELRIDNGIRIAGTI